MIIWQKVVGFVEIALWTLTKLMRKDLQDNDAGFWSEEARKLAVENGIVTGDDSKEFGDYGIFVVL